MYFNYQLFFRVIYHSLFKSGGTHTRLTKKRVLFLLGFFFVFIPNQLLNGFFLLLDWIFFPGFRNVKVIKPVFILGNPRTGSSHLLKVMARDEQTFATPKLWELVLAPSITQRKIIGGIVGIDQRLGNPIKRWAKAWQKRNLKTEGIHSQLKLSEPDEDELLFLINFSAVHFLFPFPFWEAFQPFFNFDEMVSPKEKQRFMRFYERCMQRTLYLQGIEKTYLSKSPAHCSRVETLFNHFPNAKFIYTTRNPLSVFPSTMSLFSFTCGLFSDLLTPYPFGDQILKITKAWYHGPLDFLENNAAVFTIVRFEDHVNNLAQTIYEVYADLGMEITPSYLEVLQFEVVKAQHYNSQHEYDLAEMGYTPERIIDEYRDAFDRFRFKKIQAGNSGEK